MTRVQGHGKNTQYAKKALSKAKPKTLADIKKPQIKAVKQQAAAQKAVAQNNQSVLSDLLAGTKKQTDLDAIRKEIGTYGTSAQRAELEKLNHQFKKEGQALLDDYLGNVTSKKELESLRTMVDANGSQAQKARFGQWESYFEKPTWQKYADLHGTTYTPPTSGVAEVDRQAAKIIAENSARKPFVMADPIEAFGGGSAGVKVVTPPATDVAETVTSQGWLSKLKDALTSPTAKKAYKWIGIGVGAAALGILAYKGIKALMNNNNDAEAAKQQPQQPQVKPQVQPEPQKVTKPEGKKGDDKGKDNTGIDNTPKPEEKEPKVGNKEQKVPTKGKYYYPNPGDGYEKMIREQYLPDHKELYESVKAELTKKLGKVPTDKQIAAYVTIKFCKANGIDYFNAQPKPLQADSIQFSIVK